MTQISDFLNLETYRERELFAVLNRDRERYSVAYHDLNMMAVRMTLGFLNCPDSAEKI